MTRALIYFTVVTVIMYSIVGWFGYVTWAKDKKMQQSLLVQEDLMLAPYDCLPMQLAILAICVSLVLVSPFLLIPCKNALESLFGEKMSSLVNFVVTLVLVEVTFYVSGQEYSDLLTVMGSCANICIGFTLPVMFYSKVEKSIWKMILAQLLNLVVTSIAVKSIYEFVFIKIN